MHHFELCLETTVIDFPLVVASDWLLRIFLERWNYVRRPVWGILLSPSEGRDWRAIRPIGIVLRTGGGLWELRSLMEHAYFHAADVRVCASAWRPRLSLYICLSMA